jgi:hypothetical protein
VFFTWGLHSRRSETHDHFKRNTKPSGQFGRTYCTIIVVTLKIDNSKGKKNDEELCAKKFFEN